MENMPETPTGLISPSAAMAGYPISPYVLMMDNPFSFPSTPSSSSTPSFAPSNSNSFSNSSFNFPSANPAYPAVQGVFPPPPLSGTSTASSSWEKGLPPSSSSQANQHMPLQHRGDMHSISNGFDFEDTDCTPPPPFDSFTSHFQSGSSSSSSSSQSHSHSMSPLSSGPSTPHTPSTPSLMSHGQGTRGGKRTPAAHDETIAMIGSFEESGARGKGPSGGKGKGKAPAKGKGSRSKKDLPELSEDRPTSRSRHPASIPSSDDPPLFESFEDDRIDFPPMPVPGVNDAGDLNSTPNFAVNKILEVHELILRLKEQIEHLRWEQKHTVVPVPGMIQEKLEASGREMADLTERAQEDLRTVLSTAVLAPSFLCRLLQQQHDLLLLSVRLRLFQEELLFYSSSLDSLAPRCFATLVVTRQPFPKSIKQHTKSTSSVEDPTVVNLVAAPKCDIRPTSPVKANLVNEDYQANRSACTVLNDLQELDETGVATFSDLRFPQGTKKKPVRLQFAVEVQFVQPDGSIASAVLESNQTSPFVVMTNENQWDETEGMLLKRDAFSGRPEVSWESFANTLQTHYLRATRQEPSNPHRPLSRHDLEHIHKSSFKSRMMVSQRDFEEFWKHFGKILHRIRHQKYFFLLWLQGLVYGFVSKDDAKQILQNEPEGTFMVRFSDSYAGKVALAYTKADESGRVGVSHFLVDHEADPRPLPEFLLAHEQNMISHLLRIPTDFSSSPFSSSRVDKLTVLRPFAPKPKIIEYNGYQDGMGK